METSQNKKEDINISTAINNFLFFNNYLGRVELLLASTVIAKFFYNWYQKPSSDDKQYAADIIMKNVLYKEKYDKLPISLTIIPELSNLFKLHSSGPWNIETNHKEAIE